MTNTIASLRKLGVVALLVLWGSTLRAEVCAWTGNGGDVNWQTSGNWDVLPVSGRGDTLIIPSGTSTSNDFTGLKIKALWFTGAEATAVSGNELEFSVAGSKNDFNLSNACPLQIDFPVKVTKNFFGYYAASGVDYLKPVSVVGAVQFTFGKANAADAEQGVCNFASSLFCEKPGHSSRFVCVSGRA